MIRTKQKRQKKTTRKKVSAKKRTTTPKRAGVKKFVSSFYAKYGNLMSRLSNE